MSIRLLPLALSLALVGVTFLQRQAAPWMLNVSALHNYAWATALSVYSLGWISYTPVSTMTWVIVGGSMLAFNAGVFSVATSGGSPNKLRVSPVRPPASLTPFVLAGLFFVGAFAYLFAIAGQFGLNTLFRDGQRVRSLQGTDEFIAAFPLPFRLCYFLGPLVVVLFLNPALSGLNLRRTWRYTVVGSTAFLLALSLGRTLVIVALAWQLGVWLVGKMSLPTSRPNLRHLLLYFVIGIAAFQLIANFTGKSAASDSRIQAWTTGPIAGSSLTSAYYYASGGLPTFSNLVEGVAPSHRTFGQATLAPVAKAIPGLSVPPTVSEFTNIPFPGNAYTWLEPFYLDFGGPGAVLLPFLVAVAMTICARLEHQSVVPELTLLLAFLYALTLWAPFVNQHRSTFTYEYCIVLWLMARKGRHSRRCAPHPHQLGVSSQVPPRLSPGGG